MSSGHEAESVEGLPVGSTVGAIGRPIDRINYGFDFDMLGCPIPPGRGMAGRPRHLPTAEGRARVSSMHAQGLAQGAIAKAIGITVPTLVLNYHHELSSSSQVWRRRQKKDLAE